MMHVSDWLPTLLAAAGYDVTKETDNLDGMSMWDTLQNDTPSPRNEILLNIDDQMFHNAALRFGDWKLVKQGITSSNCMFSLSSRLLFDKTAGHLFFIYFF